MTPEELRHLGLYDPAAPDAEERLALLELALERGVALDEIREAIAEKRLHAIAAVWVVEGGTERLGLDDAAARAGLDAAGASQVWRALGFAAPSDGERPCTDRDVEVFRVFDLLADTMSRDVALQIARAMGSALANVADAEVAAVRSAQEAPLRAGGGDNVDVARDLLRTAEAFMPLLAPVLDTVHRHHVAVAGRRYALWGVPPTAESTSDAVVGFADLVGFTALSVGRSATAVDGLVVEFERLVVDALASPTARLVKLIGDEAMFVVGSASEALEIARAIVRSVDGHGNLPTVRVGLAAGEVIVREGDLFGPVVNLASRLVGTAQPGQIVLDREVAQRAGASDVLALGSRTVPGFEDPVEVYTLI
jgi:class 3 adenylate cyclase